MDAKNIHSFTFLSVFSFMLFFKIFSQTFRIGQVKIQLLEVCWVSFILGASPRVHVPKSNYLTEPLWLFPCKIKIILTLNFWTDDFKKKRSGYSLSHFLLADMTEKQITVYHSSHNMGGKEEEALCCTITQAHRSIKWFKTPVALG